MLTGISHSMVKYLDLENRSIHIYTAINVYSLTNHLQVLTTVERSLSYKLTSENRQRCYVGGSAGCRDIYYPDKEKLLQYK